MSFERIGGRSAWKGQIGEVWVDQYRHDDGAVVDREVIRHPGAVVVLPARQYWGGAPRRACEGLGSSCLVGSTTPRR